MLLYRLNRLLLSFQFLQYNKCFPYILYSFFAEIAVNFTKKSWLQKTRRSIQVRLPLLPPAAEERDPPAAAASFPRNEKNIRNYVKSTQFSLVSPPVPLGLVGANLPVHLQEPLRDPHPPLPQGVQSDPERIVALFANGLTLLLLEKICVVHLSYSSSLNLTVHFVTSALTSTSPPPALAPAEVDGTGGVLS